MNIFRRPPFLSTHHTPLLPHRAAPLTLLHARPTPPQIPTPHTLARHASPRRDTGSDPKRDIIRRALYPPNVRNRASPTGAWRPDTLRALRRAAPSAPAHDTVERAFKLYLRHRRQARAGALARKWEAMRGAVAELERVDPRLAREAARGVDPRVRTAREGELARSTRVVEQRGADARVGGLFPREMRAPVDTPARGGWNYEWKPPVYWVG